MLDESNVRKVSAHDKWGPLSIEPALHVTNNDPFDALERECHNFGHVDNDALHGMVIAMAEQHTPMLTE